MALQYSVDVRNAGLDARETAIGASAVLMIRTGAPPVNCAAADIGTVLATCNLPADWMTAASGGSKSKSGTWEDLSADATGTAGHFRIYDSGGSNCKIQGTVTITAGGGDMEVDNPSFATGQAFSAITFTITDNNG